jgi:tRNA (guanine-N7-)-methyltransferase
MTKSPDAAAPAEPTGAPSLIVRPSILQRLEPASLFTAVQPIEVELGAGDGSFIAQYAVENPQTNFFAVERLLGRLRKIDRKGLRAGLQNLRLLRIEASYFVQYMLAPESVRAYHIYFPDPWPKRKHRKNRLIQPDFTELLRTSLEQRGLVYLRTDDQDYFEQMEASFKSNLNFQAAQTPAALMEVLTDFERGFHLQGISTRRAAYQRVR